MLAPSISINHLTQEVIIYQNQHMAHQKNNEGNKKLRL